MKICIVRNAEGKTNAAIARIAFAMAPYADELCLLTRNRFTDGYKGIRELEYEIESRIIANYEIALRSGMGKGIFNIFKLIQYQYFTIKWLIKNSNRYDIIHVFDLDAGLPVMLVCLFLRKKYVYHIADFYVDSRIGIPGNLKILVKKLEFLVVNRASATIVCTEKRIEQIKGSKPKKLVVVHNTPCFRSELIDHLANGVKAKRDFRNNVVFSYVGALTEDRFIKTALDVIKRYPKVSLNLAGMGELVEYIKKIAQNHSNIHYHGRIDYHKALELYSGTDFMFALYDPSVPNHKYSAPNKVYEAMALGKPIIVAKGTSVDQIVLDNNMGMVIDYSEESFERILLKILDDKVDAVALSYNSKQAYAEYSWALMKKRISNIYGEIK